MCEKFKITIKTEEVEEVNKQFKDVENLKTNCESRDLEDRIYWKNKLDLDIPELDKESIAIEKFIKNDSYDTFVEEDATVEVLNEIMTQRLAVFNIKQKYNK